MARSTYIHIKVDAKKAIKRMVDMKRRGKDFAPVFREARSGLEAWNSANFTQNGVPSGSPWNALHASTLQWKAMHYPGTSPMVRTGKLFRSLTSLKGPANKINGNEAEFGTNIEYAKFHQYGTTNMAARKLVFEPPLFARRLAQIAANYQAHGNVGKVNTP